MSGKTPPTKAEATRHVRAHRSLGKVLDAGGSIVLVEPQAGGRASGGRTVVGIHDPDGGRSLVALVDGRGVVGVHETPAHFQLSSAERTAAERLAADDDRVRAFLRRRRMNPLTRLYFPPGDRTGHRFAIVFLRPTSTERHYAVVDLTAGGVDTVLTKADLTRGA